IKPTLTLALGSCDVSVKEMVTAYSAFSNKGMRVDPIFVTRITDSSGNVISEFKGKHTEVISEDAYYKILDMLQNVVNHGTGAGVRSYGISAQMGGKTGTTNSNSDGWFMGFTPELVTGVWVGGEERFIHFNTMAYGQGAAMALPIYGKYMKRVYSDPSLPYKQSTKFDIPEGLNLCGNSLYRQGSSAKAPESSIEGIFD
ncbi:MAG: penicillin-binding protein, partial [Muribaculaceae bacterium]|nr:penicillin-binding protein [Muribaculaceae bacterium]